MARFYPSGGAGGGSGSDECTATVSQVLSGYTAITKDSGDEPIAGGLPNRTGQLARKAVWYNNNLLVQGPNGYYASNNANGDFDIQVPLAAAKTGLGLTEAKIMKGQSVGYVAGSATADANAAAGDVLAGKTAYVNGAKITGNMPARNSSVHGLGLGWNSSGLYYYVPKGYYQEGANNPWVYMTRAEIASIVTSAVSFRVAQYANLTMIATWARPSKGPWSGLRVMAKQGSYPANVNDGTRIYHGSGTSVTTTLAAGVWYFRAWNYLTCKDGGTIYGGYAQTTCNNAVIRGQQNFTASGTFTVPANVRSIDIFVVGGGGGCKSDESNPSGGGGGGYAKTYKGIAVTPGQALDVSIGSGGVDGTATSVGSYSAAGGKGNSGQYSPWNHRGGAPGGSGGGACTLSDNEASGGAGDGGSNGSGGGDGTNESDRVQFAGGSGQGSSTRAFGEAGGELYSGGGGGYGYTTLGGYWSKAGRGGAGGGGDALPKRYFGGNDGNGVAHTGGGGCGLNYDGEGNSPHYRYGGSGVAIVRWGY